MICPTCQRQTIAVNHNNRGPRCIFCWARLPDAPDVDATDAARRLAEEYGVDLATIEGSGKDGRILARDVKDNHK